MALLKRINKFLVSSAYKGKPLLEKKVALLRAQLSLLLGAVGIFYIIVDTYFGYFHNVGIYFGLFVAAAVVIILNRKGFEQLSNLILLTTVNVVVYLFAASDINHKVASGVFFIPVAFCAVTIYGHKKRHIGLLFALISAVLFYISVYVDFTVLRVPDNSFPDYVFKQFYLINVMVCLLVGAMNISFFLRINHESENELLMSRQKIEEAYTRLDKLFYVVSHDLKAPLNSIKGLINVSKNTDDIHELKDYIQMMEERTLASQNFIAEIADYSRTTNTTATITAINLQKAVKEIVELVRHSENAIGILFIVSIPKHFIIQCDPLRVRIILSNLISNAIQYHHKNKSGRFIEISARTNENVWEISVSDNGMGIEEEHIGKIFQMFYRGTNQVSGSGLGLYLVQDAIRSLAGSISVESTPGEGTKFNILLPMQAATNEPVESPADQLQEA